jgi:hypothetical protein
VVDNETQAKIDVVKQRLIKYFGYNETSATDVLRGQLRRGLVQHLRMAAGDDLRFLILDF